MKKIIFDLDNTLIFWKNEYIFALKDTLKLYDIDNDEIMMKIDYYIEQYEKDNNYLTKELFVEYLNKNCDTNLDLNFVDILLKKQELCAEKSNNELIKTLEYLSSKYELYVLSNWFTTCQMGRLRTAKIDKYFKLVVGGEGDMKPTKEAFLKVLKEDEFKDSIMVGDSMYFDILPASKLGIKSILYNYKNKDIEEGNYLVINDLNKLREML